MNKFEYEEGDLAVEKIEEGEDKFKFLILYNDDFNTFDYVIESLIDVCKHDYIQACQCAHITHEKGKCDVKKGSYDELSPMKTELTNRGLTVGID
jgi:ATP-dependent Clp protease adaptor protein ClpS